MSLVDLPQKTRHATQMACASRALARSAPSDHLKRIVGRFAFVHLHDVVRFAPTWRNQLLQEENTKPTAIAALPALKRLRKDWENYQDVRHFLAAKRARRDPTDAPADQLETFKLWSDIGALSLETLVDDAIELYVQLAALESLPSIETDPAVAPALVGVMADFEPVGEEAFLEVNASSFASARPNTVALRMGGELGRLVPLINDVAESAALLAALAATSPIGPVGRLVTCSLPSEIHEVLRLSVGPPAAVQQHTPDATSLLALYRATGNAPPDTVTVLEQLDASIPEATQESLYDWRVRLGAHTDDETPWPVLEEGIEAAELNDYCRLWEWVVLSLEHAACTSGGPLLLLGSRRFKTLFAPEGYEGGLPYEESESGPVVDPGDLRSALPPDHVDSEYVIWVNGPSGSTLAPGVAGMLAGRSREVTERLEAWNDAHKS